MDKTHKNLEPVKRECFSCKNFYNCKHRKGKKEGCLNYESIKK